MGQAELVYALNDERYSKRIIPIAYKTCNFKLLSWTLGTIQWVDFTGEFADGCRDLLRIWGLGLAPRG